MAERLQIADLHLGGADVLATAVGIGRSASPPCQDSHVPDVIQISETENLLKSELVLFAREYDLLVILRRVDESSSNDSRQRLSPITHRLQPELGWSKPLPAAGAMPVVR